MAVARTFAAAVVVDAALPALRARSSDDQLLGAHP